MRADFTAEKHSLAEIPSARWSLVIMPAAARIADMHTCPMSTGPVPHVGGPIAVGCPTVLIGGMPAARLGDMVTCCGPPDTIAMGSPTVFIGGMPAARMGDLCAHGGTITVGFPQVMIGEMGGAPSLPSIACELPSLTVPRLKHFHLHIPAVFSSFAKGFKNGMFNKQVLFTFVGRAACVAIGANPEIVGVVLAVYGAYSLYKTCNELGDGNAWDGLKKIGSSLANGDANSYAELAGDLAAIAVVGKTSGAIGGQAEGANALNGMKNASKMSQIDDALDSTSKVAKGASSLEKISKAGDALDYANAAGEHAERSE